MYDIDENGHENNDAVTYAQNNNDANCECKMQLRMYKKRMLKNKL